MTNLKYIKFPKVKMIITITGASRRFSQIWSQMEEMLGELRRRTGTRPLIMRDRHSEALFRCRVRWKCIVLMHVQLV